MVEACSLASAVFSSSLSYVRSSLSRTSTLQAGKRGSSGAVNLKRVTLTPRALGSTR